MQYLDSSLSTHIQNSQQRFSRSFGWRLLCSQFSRVRLLTLLSIAKQAYDKPVFSQIALTSGSGNSKPDRPFFTGRNFIHFFNTG